MKKTEYFCDLCEDKVDEEDLVPISVENLRGRARLVRCKISPGQCERHICKECIEDIKAL